MFFYFSNLLDFIVFVDFIWCVQKIETSKKKKKVYLFTHSGKIINEIVKLIISGLKRLFK